MTERRQGRDFRAAISGLTAAAALLAAVGSLLALVVSWRANDIATQANQINRANSQPQPYVTLIKAIYPTNPTAVDQMGLDELCLSQNLDQDGRQYATWDEGFILMVDIDNNGSIGMALSKIQSDWQRTAIATQPNAFYQMVRDVNATPVLSQQDLQSWFDRTGTPVWDDLKNISYGPMPINIDPGVTVRLALSADDIWWIWGGLQPDSLSQLRPFGGSHDLDFTFSNGDHVSLSVPAPDPPELVVPVSSGSTYPPCP